jgi:hypothetical protein
MNGESARLGALSNKTPKHRSQLAGRAIVHLRDGITYTGWVEVGGGVLTIDGSLRTTTGPRYRSTYIYRPAVQRTYPVRAVKRIDWETGE